MRIGVSAWRWGGQPLGIGRYIEYLLKFWSRMVQADDRVIIFTHAPFDRTLLDLSPAFAARVLAPKMTNALWENLLLRRAARDLDVLFGPTYTIPLRYRGRSVVAIHSVDEAEPGVHSMWHRLTFSQRYRSSARSADRVIVNSQSTKDRVRDMYGISDDKIEVIWLGVDDAFRPSDDAAAVRATRMQYLGVDRPYILFVGGLSRRRNIPTLLEAFSRLKNARRSNTICCSSGQTARTCRSASSPRNWTSPTA